MFNNMTYEEVYDRYIQPQKVQAFDEGYQQGRADAIEELEKILNNFYHKKNNLKSEFRPSIVLTERDAESVLKQLKEQI